MAATAFQILRFTVWTLVYSCYVGIPTSALIGFTAGLTLAHSAAMIPTESLNCLAWWSLRRLLEAIDSVESYELHAEV